MNVYFFNGIGNSIAIFQKLKLHTRITPIFIKYHLPHPKTSLEDFVTEMKKHIDETKPFCLVGLSFGGLVVTELNKICTPEKTILISSIAQRKELPKLYRLAGRLGLYYFVPTWIKPKNWDLELKGMGIKNEENKLILKKVFTASNPKFTKWAMTKVITWKNKDVPKNLFRIHGTKDNVLPITSFTPNHIIKNAGHIMTLENAGEVSDYLNKTLADI